MYQLLCFARNIRMLNNTIKLKAAIVLMKCAKNGLAILQTKAAEQPEPFERILNHMKTVR